MDGGGELGLRAWRFPSQPTEVPWMLKDAIAGSAPLPLRERGWGEGAPPNNL